MLSNPPLPFSIVWYSPNYTVCQFNKFNQNNVENFETIQEKLEMLILKLTSHYCDKRKHGCACKTVSIIKCWLFSDLAAIYCLEECVHV